MGLSSSPYIATMAMNYTFSDSVLEKFKEEMGYSDFDFSRYDEFLSYCLDDCIIFTSKSKKTDKYNSKQIHLIALEAVIYALNMQGWIASLHKANLMSDQLVFLGEFICTKTDTSRIQSNCYFVQYWCIRYSRIKYCTALHMLCKTTGCQAMQF